MRRYPVAKPCLTKHQLDFREKQFVLKLRNLWAPYIDVYVYVYLDGCLNRWLSWWVAGGWIKLQLFCFVRPSVWLLMRIKILKIMRMGMRMRKLANKNVHTQHVLGLAVKWTWNVAIHCSPALNWGTLVSNCQLCSEAHLVSPVNSVWRILIVAIHLYECT